MDNIVFSISVKHMLKYHNLQFYLYIKLQRYTYIYIYPCTGILLVGGFNPSEKYQSVGINSHKKKENKIHVPRHQPDYIFSIAQRSNIFRQFQAAMIQAFPRRKKRPGHPWAIHRSLSLLDDTMDGTNPASPKGWLKP